MVFLGFVFFSSSGKPLLKAIPFASLWEKVRRLKKSTPPPVVAVVTNIRYGRVTNFQFLHGANLLVEILSTRKAFKF